MEDKTPRSQMHGYMQNQNSVPLSPCPLVFSVLPTRNTCSTSFGAPVSCFPPNAVSPVWEAA